MIAIIPTPALFCVTAVFPDPDAREGAPVLVPAGDPSYDRPGGGRKRQGAHRDDRERKDPLVTRLNTLV
jgi:hypothetical protein